jgi:predicted deacylase
MSESLSPPDLSRWRAGNTGTEGVWRFTASPPGPSALVSALVHGNEICGAWALSEWLAAGVAPRRGTLTLAFCNLAAFDRFDARNHDAARFVDQDFNRVWTDARIDAGSTSETRRAQALRPFVRAADRLLDLHSMHEPGAPLALSGVAPRNVAFARSLALPATIIVDAGHPEGVRMRDYGPFAPDASAGTCAVLVECGYHLDASSRAIARDALARFLVAVGSIDAGDVPSGWRLPDPPPALAIEVTAPVVARSMAFRFERPLASLECIPRAGTVVGRDGDAEFRTPYDDCYMVMPSLRQLRPGVTVVRFGRRLAGGA